MSERRVGGHVAREKGGWIPAELAEPLEEEVSLSKANKKAELLEAADAAGVEVDESMTKAEILEALDG